MKSQIAIAKDKVMELLSDEKEHTTEEIRNYIIVGGCKTSTRSCVVRSAIYQLRHKGIDICSRDKGIYQLRTNKGR